MHPRLFLSSLLTIALLAPPPVNAQPQTFSVQTQPELPRVEFFSKATLENFTGKTEALSGYFSLDPADLAEVSGELVVDLASLDTGIGLRNKHMRDNVLHTKEHPTAVFVPHGCRQGGSLIGTDLPETIMLHGSMTLHGVTQPLNANVAAKLDPDGTLAFVARFDIRLSDFGIKRPKMLMMKVAETVVLTVEGHARPRNPSDPGVD